MTDLRPDRPDLWSEPSAFGDRAHFRVSTRPAVLSVTGVQRFDAGTYTCRVDFRQSPTVYHHVKLDIIGKFIYSFILLQTKKQYFSYTKRVKNRILIFHQRKKYFSSTEWPFLKPERSEGFKEGHKGPLEIYFFRMRKGRFLFFDRLKRECLFFI